MEERVSLALEHLRMAVHYKGERRAVMEMRKHYVGYLRGLPNNRSLRIALMKPQTLAEIEDFLHSFVYYEQSQAA
jgi:tRNA-dihydrouridine synthase